MSAYELITQPQFSSVEFGFNTANANRTYITELQFMHNNDIEKYFLNALSLLPVNIITKFSMTQGTIYCVNENEQIGFYLVRNHMIEKERIKKIERFDIDGIPGECFSDTRTMADYLSKANKHLVEYEDHSGYKLRVNLGGLKGGGNMMASGYKWPVMGVGKNARIVIPYFLSSSKQNNKALTILLHDPITSKRRAQLVEKIISGQANELKLEAAALKSIKISIQEWNKTGVVELISLAKYEKRYGSAPKRWIGFHTNNEDGICQAPCIGMCPGAGEHIVTCDIEGKFHPDSIQSIMHEVGHVIGLRHEHARDDRDDFVETNLPEKQDGRAFGKYDYYSVMHYAFGNYDDKKYLRLSKSLNRSDENIKKLHEEVGKMPRISAGDIKTIKKLYEAEFKAAVKEKIDNKLQRLSALNLSSNKATQKYATAAALTAAAASANTAYHCTEGKKTKAEQSQTYLPSSKLVYQPQVAPHTSGGRKVKQSK